MNAEILYKVYETTRKHNAPDLTIGLAMLKDEQPELKITQEEDRCLREFIGRHGQALSAAFPDVDAFEAAVAAGVKADEEAAQEAAQEAQEQ